MLKRKGEIDGFWLFIIGIFVVLPLSKTIFNANKTEETATNETVQVEGEEPAIPVFPTIKKHSKGKIVEISHNSGTSYINTQVRIPIAEEVVRLNFTKPNKEKLKFKNTYSKYFPYVFTEEGRWSIDMYDKDGIMIEWIQITVY
jgi:hypothetical protein